LLKAVEKSAPRAAAFVASRKLWAMMASINPAPGKSIISTPVRCTLAPIR
jgi:hypothetical protein